MDLVFWVFMGSVALIALSFLLSLILLFRNHRFYKKHSEQGTKLSDLHESIKSLEKKVDELRLQTGIVSARQGDYGALIALLSSNSYPEVERKKPGWPAGKPRGPKKEAIEEKLPSE